MSTTAPPTESMFILLASKRALTRAGRHGAWEPDEEGFLRRWPNNTRPDIGVQRSTNAMKLSEQAAKLNNAQINSGFLDWLYFVDLDTPVHPPCTDACRPEPENGETP